MNQVDELQQLYTELRKNYSQILNVIAKTDAMIQETATKLWLRPLDLSIARIQATIKQMKETSSDNIEVENEEDAAYGS